jgi:hypothetical protein
MTNMFMTRRSSAAEIENAASEFFVLNHIQCEVITVYNIF